MKIAYLDGSRFYRAFRVGGAAIIRNQKELDRINVFPVADADTGINLASTIEAVLSRSEQKRGLKDTIKLVADSALMGARGNSGIILAQYLHGLRMELPDISNVSAREFAESARRAVRHMYSSLMNPVEGTMLTVLREWSEFLAEHSKQVDDFHHLLKSSLETARKSLKETPSKLGILAESNVVDAGAKGIVYFLEAIVDYIERGSVRQASSIIPQMAIEDRVEVHSEAPKTHRYCIEAMYKLERGELEDVKASLTELGDSLILAGSKEKAHFHLHSQKPEQVFGTLFDLGKVSSLKIDDMQRQYEISHARKYKIGILTDSACDLPDELMDKHQIVRLALGINFGERFYLDRASITSATFYQMLRSDPHHPVSSQPSPASIKAALVQLSENYEQVIAVHLSNKLSGVYSGVAREIEAAGLKNVHLVNSRQLSVTEGLVVLRLAQAIESGRPYQEIVGLLDSWSDNSKIYTDVNTLKYMVRGGRVPALTGFVAKVLNLKPIVSVDKSGKAEMMGKSFSRKQNMKKILNLISRELGTRRIWNYAIVHADDPDRAAEYASKLYAITGKEPAYTMPLSPVVGVHNGIGAVAIGVLYESD
jgi:DegV family protein with EDD domain